jgi:tetraacyldisaccharide 4'-kinase
MNRTIEIPLSLGYAMAIRLWRLFYDKKVFPRRRSPVPAIGIGNLTTGGSGKTPLVIALASLYTEKGRKVGILSRGYGGKRSEDSMVFRGGDDVDPDIVGDEPALMAKKLPACTFVLSSDRYRGALELEASGVDLVILDDGFQSLELIQDCQCVFFPDAWIRDPKRVRTDFMALVPYGPLRDYPRTLNDADAILYNEYEETYATGEIPEPGLPERIRRILESIDPALGKIPVVGQRIRYAGIVDRDFRPVEETDTIRSKRMVLVSGIGHPERFHRLVERLGIDAVDRLVLPDHVRYDGPTLAIIRKWLDRVNEMERAEHVDMILTTEKDLVKWRRGVWEGPEIRAVSIRSELIDSGRWLSMLGKGWEHVR